MAPSTSGGLSWSWIISPRQDLVWLIGGAVAAWLMMVLLLGLKIDLIAVWFVWVIFVDTPHFFGTYARTLLDREERRRWGKLIILSTGMWLVGPAAVLVGGGLYHWGVSWYQLPWKVFLGGFLFWAYWHVIRQHYGLLALYRRKHGDNGHVDQRIDWWGMHLALIAPALSFALRNEETRIAFGLGESIGSIETVLIWGFGGMGVLGGFAIAGRQWWRHRKGLSVNGSKLLFVGAVVPVYWAVCLHPLISAAPLLAFSIFVTIHHDLQYQAIVWFYLRNRYRGVKTARERFGIAVDLSRNLGVFLGCGILIAIVFRLLGCGLEITEGCIPVLRTSEAMLWGNLTMRDLFTGVFLGFPLQHYLLDQYIWRPSKSAELRRDLDMDESASQNIGD